MNSLNESPQFLHLMSMRLPAARPKGVMPTPPRPPQAGALTLDDGQVLSHAALGRADAVGRLAAVHAGV